MSLLANHGLIGGQRDVIRHFGTSFQIATNSATIVPLGGMVTGDFVYVKFCVGSSGRTGSISTTGGQSWTLTQDNTFGTLGESWTAWCVFNGTWGANPVFAISGSLVAKVYVMHVFRSVVGLNWAIDVAMGFSGDVAVTVHPITGQTVISNLGLTIASWQGLNDVYSGTTAFGWRLLGAESYDDPGPNSRTLSFAYKIGGPGPTGNVNKTTLNAVDTKHTIITFSNT